jgi:exopolyphosphatase/guanosine-5'-triphosphate,3'-diphosphate pyrophosphatase
MHHKHTFYLLSAVPIVGLTPAQAAIVANVARYHRKSFPKTEHEPYGALPARDRVTVSKLASILRLADALDYEHAGKVHEIDVEATSREVMLKLSGRGDLMLEKWALARNAAFFESVFPAKVRVGS